MARDWYEFLHDHLTREGHPMTMLRFPGLDGHQVAVRAVDIHHVVSLHTGGMPHCNLHYNNGHFSSVKGTLEEVLAIVELGHSADYAKELELHRKRAQERRQAEVDVEAAIRESDLFTDKYRTVRHHIETDEFGAKYIRIQLRPHDHPAYNEKHPANQPSLEEKKELDAKLDASEQKPAEEEKQVFRLGQNAPKTEG